MLWRYLVPAYARPRRSRVLSYAMMLRVGGQLSADQRRGSCRGTARLVCYACATRWPVLTTGMPFLRCYACATRMAGTDRGYALPKVLRMCYAMSGTDLGYAGRHALREARFTQPQQLPRSRASLAFPPN
eukprot:3522548-Rhodomonas_salina.2